MTGFVSNSLKVLKMFDATDLAQSITNIDVFSDMLPSERALGLMWDVRKDLLGYKVNINSKVSTRRQVLANTYSLYDPLGLVSPILVKPKSIFQRAWKLGLDWDDRLSVDLLNEWNEWYNSIL